jgi:hypothetical protein
MKSKKAAAPPENGCFQLPRAGDRVVEASEKTGHLRRTGLFIGRAPNAPYFLDGRLDPGPGIGQHPAGVRESPSGRNSPPCTRKSWGAFSRRLETNQRRLVHSPGFARQICQLCCPKTAGKRAPAFPGVTRSDRLLANRCRPTAFFTHVTACRIAQPPKGGLCHEASARPGCPIEPLVSYL